MCSGTGICLSRRIGRCNLGVDCVRVWDMQIVGAWLWDVGALQLRLVSALHLRYRVWIVECLSSSVCRQWELGYWTSAGRFKYYGCLSCEEHCVGYTVVFIEKENGKEWSLESRRFRCLAGVLGLGKCNSGITRLRTNVQVGVLRNCWFVGLRCRVTYSSHRQT